MSEKKTGGQIIWESLMHEGVDVVFGITGGAILPTYDDLSKYNYPIHAITATHEQGALHMADGYARATGKVGVTICTSGPGATNLNHWFGDSAYGFHTCRSHNRAGFNQPAWAVMVFRSQMFLA